MFGIHIPNLIPDLPDLPNLLDLPNPIEEAKKILRELEHEANKKAKELEHETTKMTTNCAHFAKESFGAVADFTEDNVKPLVKTIEDNVKPMAKAFAENHPLLDTLMDQFKDMSIHEKFKRKLKKASSHAKVAASILEGLTGVFAEKATTAVFDSWDDIDSFIDRQNENEIKIAYYIYCVSFGATIA